MRTSKCDRCKKVDYEVRCARDYHIYNGPIRPKEFFNLDRYIDLCDDCYKDFVAWLDSKRLVPPENAAKTAKAEACKEFAEKLKNHKRKRLWNSTVLVEDIDNVLKEMAGEGEK